jgi:signal transduction histidine kinase
MRDGTDEIVKTKLYGEIETLENQYRALKGYLAGEEADRLEIMGAAKGFRDTLNKISTHILTLYTLEGKKTKITWDPLLTNINNALERLQSSASAKTIPTIQLALNISEPKIEEVTSFLLKLKKSLQ